MYLCIYLQVFLQNRFLEIELESVSQRVYAFKIFIDENFMLSNSLSKSLSQDFAVGTVVKNLPASAGDMGLIPGLGRSHMLPSN